MASVKLVKSNPRLRVIWALDLGQSAVRFSEEIPKILRYIVRSTGAIIEPVYVLKMLPEIYGDFTAKWLPEYYQAALDRLEEVIEALNLDKITTPQVIFHDNLSTRGAVQTLSEHAARRGADIIIAQTHGREGVKRLFLGSFAETLLFQSHVPVMLISRDMKEFRNFKSILFPTDFGPTSRMRFHRVLELAQKFGARVTLFHSVQNPIDQAVSQESYPGGDEYLVHEYIENQIGAAKRRAASWSEVAEDRGIAMDFVIDEKGLNIADQVIQLARKREIGMIAMESHSGPVSSAVLGSYTRQVARQAPCPVLVLKPRLGHALRVMPSVREKEIKKAA